MWAEGNSRATPREPVSPSSPTAGGKQAIEHRSSLDPRGVAGDERPGSVGEGAPTGPAARDRGTGYWASGHGSLSWPADVEDRRAHRAAELAEALLAAEGVEGSVREAIDEEWDGTGGSDAGVEYVLGLPESGGKELEEADA